MTGLEGATTGLDATAIARSFLEDTSRAVMTEDWAAFRARVILPFTLITRTATIQIDSEDKLQMGFTSFHQMLTLQGVTKYDRRVEDAVELDPELVSATYTTRLTSGQLLVVPAFRSQVTLRCRVGVWRAAAISNALANSQWPVLVPRPDGEGKDIGRGT